MNRSRSTSSEGPIHKMCPHLGPSGFCGRTDCWQTVNGECKWREENTVIVYDNNTGAHHVE